MLKKALMLSLALTAVALMPARRGEASDCYSQCDQSYQTCRSGQCTLILTECGRGYIRCNRSCDLGVGPWLIC